ncbi:MAG TPA: tetratricopeptide repeat protein [Stellaceae bacterium]|nr:tetratricopeptide repeat protein [Stellaceae bacterium]
MPQRREGELPAANKIFVGRQAEQKIFEDAAFAVPADRSALLVFHGAGGEGKTALCRKLMHETGAQGDPSYGFLRRAELDLHGRTKGDPDRLLVWIRNGFAEAGVAFPCFDLAFAIAWEATRGDEALPVFTRAWLRRTTMLGESMVEDAVSAAKGLLKEAGTEELIGDLIGGFPGIGFILKRIGHWTIEKGKRLYLERTQEALQALYREGEIKKPYELSHLMPWMLAQDLNAHRAAHPEERFVLFIDEYERVFDEAGAGSAWEENPFDSHLRRLIAETNGMLAVFFSREPLPWRGDWRDDLAGRQHRLSGLAATEAETFLRAIPIEDPAIRQAIIAGARETARPHSLVYPLLLDLQVEHWRNLKASGAALAPQEFQVAAASFEERRREIVGRVLRDYGLALQTTLERLSVARRFDRKAFAHVVQSFGTALPLDQFDRIADLSFVTRGADGFLTMHNAIAETIRATLSPEKRATSVAALLRHFEERATLVAARQVTDETVAVLVEAAFLRLAQGAEGYVSWLSKMSKVVYDAARFAGLAGPWREAAAIGETQLGPDHPDTATSLNNLALLLKDQGDLAAARPLFERALATYEKALGHDHPDTAASLNNLAGLLKDQGDLAAAQPLFERALAICEKALGPDHPHTATSLNNLASLLQAKGDLAAARPLFERALATYEKALGHDHPDTATSLSNLAFLLHAQGDFAAARPLFERALAIREKALGPDHPDTATSLNNLAGLLQGQGDLAAARPRFERALAIREKALGPDHPDTAGGLNNLAGLLQAQGDLAGARPLFERALAIREKALGPDHPDTATSLNNLAGLLRDQGDLAAARPLFERALALREKALGHDHPNTAGSLNNLALLLRARGDLAAARPLFERALATCEKTLGHDHPNTATSLNNLASLLQDQGDFAAARPLFERALAIREKALGHDHPDTAGSLNNLALLLRARGDLAAARPLFERALAIYEKTLGHGHPNTVIVRDNLSKLGDR